MTGGPPSGHGPAAADGPDALLLADFGAALAAAVAAGRRLDRRELARYRDAGRRAALDGVALRSLVELYLAAAWRLWPDLPEVVAGDPAGVVRAGQVMLRSADDAVAAVIEGFQLARRDVVRGQAAARREFIDDLLMGGAQALPGLARRAGDFGLSLAGPQAVVVVRAERRFADAAPVTAQLERSIQGASADADALVTTKDGQLVVVFAAPDRAAVEEVITGLTGSLPVQTGGVVTLRRAAAVGPWRMGVGRPHPGPGGVRSSYREALDALELGARLGGDRQVLDAADLMMHRVLIRDRAAMLEMLDVVLAPLAHARGGVEPMLATLQAYFEAGGNASAAARALHLSVRALTYRLARIAELTGRDPADPVQRFELQTALTGARLLGWSGPG